MIKTLIGIGYLVLCQAAAGLSLKPGADVPDLSAPYLGQPLPSRRAVVFAPGLVSTRENFEFSSTFSPDGGEFYFTRRGGDDRNTIYFSKRTPEGWTRPAIVSFSGEYADHEPSMFPDGRRIFWGSDRPLPDGNMKYKIWTADRISSGWGPARPLADPAGEDFLMYVTFTREGAMYATGIVRSFLRDGKFQRTVKLGPPVNDGYHNAHPYIDRDGRFLIFDSNRPGNFGRSDLFISFVDEKGEWSEPRNLGREINRGSWNSCPMVSPDDRFFFFSVDGDIFWMDALYLDAFRPKGESPQGGGPLRDGAATGG